MSKEQIDTSPRILEASMSTLDKFKLGGLVFAVGGTAVSLAVWMGLESRSESNPNVPTNCFTGTMTERSIQADLTTELEQNADIDNINDLHSIRSASRQIAEQMGGAGQLGDTYTYGVAPSGKVTGACAE
jgi:hypothetical protein